MSSFLDDERELLELTDELCNGQSDIVQRERLESLLLADPEARRIYLTYVMLHAELSLGEMEPESAHVDIPAHLLDASTDSLASEGGIELPLVRYPMGGDAISDRISRMAKSSCEWALRWRPTSWRLASLVAVLAVAVMLPLYYFFLAGPQAPLQTTIPAALPVAQLTSADDCEWLDKGDPSNLPGAAIAAGHVYRLKSGRAEISFEGGARTVLEGPTEFVVGTPTSGRLHAGTISTYVPPTARGFTVHTPAVRIVDLGTRFTASVDEAGVTEVKVVEGIVELRRRAPKHYWSFDEAQGPITDQISGRPTMFGPHASKTAGLIGGGAVRFDNQVGSAVYLGNGGATRQDPGGFAVGDGLSIEAVFVSRWSGADSDYDHLFRKEDGSQRILLAFQNPAGVPDAISYPPFPSAPCLAFGLRLTGQAYHELDMPLDGRDGRPSFEEITDGSPHHVVASYDAASGKKSIYIDGRHCMTAYYPPGTQIVSGGAASAVIGGCTRFILESFHGVIDEVAWYDFALSDDEVARHWQCVREGQSYLGEMPDARSPASPIRLQTGESMRFNAETGRPLK